MNAQIDRRLSLTIIDDNLQALKAKTLGKADQAERARYANK